MVCSNSSLASLSRMSYLSTYPLILSILSLYTGILEKRIVFLMSNNSLRVLFSSMANTTVLGVMTLATFIDLKRIRLWMILDSFSSNTPSFTARLVNAATSSRLVVWVSLLLKALVINSENFTKGYKQNIMVFRITTIHGAICFQ